MKVVSFNPRSAGLDCPNVNSLEGLIRLAEVCARGLVRVEISTDRGAIFRERNVASWVRSNWHPDGGYLPDWVAWRPLYEAIEIEEDRVVFHTGEISYPSASPKMGLWELHELISPAGDTKVVVPYEDSDTGHVIITLSSEKAANNLWHKLTQHFLENWK